MHFWCWGYVGVNTSAEIKGLCRFLDVVPYTLQIPGWFFITFWTDFDKMCSFFHRNKILYLTWNDMVTTWCVLHRMCSKHLCRIWRNPNLACLFKYSYRSFYIDWSGIIYGSDLCFQTWESPVIPLPKTCKHSEYQTGWELPLLFAISETHYVFPWCLLPWQQYICLETLCFQPLSLTSGPQSCERGHQWTHCWL